MSRPADRVSITHVTLAVMGRPRKHRQRSIRRKRTGAQSAAYLSDQAFLAKHRGPIVPSGYAQSDGSRDPSPEQIRRMCRAIRKGWSEEETIIRQRCSHMDDVTALTLEREGGIRVYASRDLARIA